MVEVEVRHRQGARYQYDVLVQNVVVTAAAAAGMEVWIGLSREGQAVRNMSLISALDILMKSCRF